MLYLGAFFLWQIDNNFCPQITELRASIGSLLAPVTQLHAWWHFGTGFGTYMHIVTSAALRCEALGIPYEIKVSITGVAALIPHSPSVNYTSSRTCTSSRPLKSVSEVAGLPGLRRKCTDANLLRFQDFDSRNK